MKLVVIGGSTGGASAAARARRLDPRARIIILEKGEHVSYSNCALPYYIGGVVEDSDELLLMTPQKFKRQHDIEVRTLSEALAIDRAGKKVRVLDLRSGESYEESYDKLVLAPGARPLLPKNVEGIDGENVFVIRSVNDVVAIRRCLDRPQVKSVAVVGGGFIGMETVENLCRAGKRVSVLARGPQIMAPFDYDMVQLLHKELMDNGVELYLNTSPLSIEAGLIRAENKAGERLDIPADAVILSAGVAPDTALASAAGLELGESGGIRVDGSFRSSDPDIYAVGDAVELFDAMSRRPGRLSLAGPAQRQARVAADSIYGQSHIDRGYIGSSCVRLFSQNAACTGLNAKNAEKAGLRFDYVTLYPMDKVGLMPDSNYMALKLLFEKPTGRILGAQAIGRGAVEKRVDVIAAMISLGGTLEDLKELELCYSPVFGTAKDAVNQAALVGLNVLQGRFRQVHVDEVRPLVEKGAYIVDVREEGEYAAGHLRGSHNVPLSQLRERMDEIPRDIPVYLHCRSSQRSYYAICFLQGMGYNDLYNISGSYLGISLYEYYNDQTLGREPILSAYNFD